MKIRGAQAIAASVFCAGAIASAVAQDITVDAGRGPVQVNVPPGYDPNVPAPLVLLLHGYGASGALQELYMRFEPLSDERGFLYAHPDGLVDDSGLRYWNATDACCDLFGASPDDSGYLRDLIGEIQAALNVDPKRIHLIGHSNGGYMSYRMACDHADLIAGIASLAGATWLDATRCTPSEPVHVLQIHGTDDTTVLFDGGCFDTGCYPGAIDTLRQWAAFDACSGPPQPEPKLNLAALPLGDETRVGALPSCAPGGSAELWAMVGAGHVPILSVEFNDLVIEHLLARPKP